MSRIEHHPSEETLYSYAAGALSAALALVVGCHLQYCPQCRKLAGEAEMLGGDLLANIDEKPLSAGRRDAVMALLDDGPAPREPAPPPRKLAIEVPGLLRNLVDHDDFDSLPWKSIVPGMKQVDLKLGEGEARLLRIAAGKRMRVHSHQGNELTLILRGGYSDSLGKFNAGDFAELDGSVQHQPVADADEDCICLAGMDAPLAFKGVIAKMLQPLFKI